MSDGKEIVLKLGVPCEELMSEVAALNVFDGIGAARLLDYDAQIGALLIERVIPGTPLFKVQHGPASVRTAAALMRRLWRPASDDSSFPTLIVWFGAFERLRQQDNGGTGPFPSQVITKAEHTLTELIASSRHRMVLHGDLHHSNILLSESSEWLAIDPKGISGDPGYEIGPFMLNQLPINSTSATMEILNHRIAVFSEELNISRERLGRWAYCYAVLSALWDFEEAAEWSDTINLAIMLDQLA